MKTTFQISLSVIILSILIIGILVDLKILSFYVQDLPLMAAFRCGIHTNFLQPNNIELDVIVSYNGKDSQEYCDGAFVRMAAFFSDYTLPFSLERYNWKIRKFDCSAYNKSRSVSIQVYSSDKNFSINTCNKFKTSE